MSKEIQAALRKMLFAYLLISKVLYYFYMVTSSLTQGGFSNMGQTVLARLLTQDMPIILVILLTFNTEKLVTSIISRYSKTVNQIVVHIIDYVLYIGVIVIYLWIMVLIGLFPNMNWREIIIYHSILYLVIVAAMEAKTYVKKKEITKYVPNLNTDEKLAMLKTLLDNNVLTQAEYDSKKEKL